MAAQEGVLVGAFRQSLAMLASGGALARYRYEGSRAKFLETIIKVIMEDLHNLGLQARVMR